MGSRDDKERERQGREALSKFFYDIAKCIFVGLVIGGILLLRDEDYSPWAISFIVFGIGATAIFAALGQHIISKKP